MADGQWDGHLSRQGVRSELSFTLEFEWGDTGAGAISGVGTDSTGVFNLTGEVRARHQRNPAAAAITQYLPPFVR